MSHTKKKKLIFHEPSTQEIFKCLSEMPKWSELLLTNSADKIYKPFLQWLIEVNFFNGGNEKRTVKQISTGFKTDTTKVTKWIHEIYDDIFELNYDKPELFQTKGINVSLHMKHYDNYCTFNVSLPVLPREFERFEFSFASAKMGISFFWVKQIDYTIGQNQVSIGVKLEGGFVNKYREFALDKALFQGWIDDMDVFHKHSFEIDNEIVKLYPH